MRYRISFKAERNFTNKETGNSYKKGVTYIKKVDFNQLRQLIKYSMLKTKDYQILDIAENNDRIGV